MTLEETKLQILDSDEFVLAEVKKFSTYMN